MLKFGLQKTTLIDFPEEVACTLFTAGCNLRCPFCHNPELVIDINPSSLLFREEVFNFLKKRKGLLGGVCLSGGEPLMHPELPEMITEIRQMGFKIKIDTNGTYPERLKVIHADYIAMDIKTTPERYSLLHPDKTDLSDKIKESVKFLLNSGIAHEFRTTLVPGIFRHEDIIPVAGLIQGADKYILTSYDPHNALDPEYRKIKAYPKKEIEKFAESFRNLGLECLLRM
ncbi:MAG: anaerobic ribonucleoside-triphosphate reductase activating protein [Spirochaetales bacterium]|nr:anaerobic ribonucleoside-triphosphate reductase activating protein [Spirochaetales bacterium]